MKKQWGGVPDDYEPPAKSYAGLERDSHARGRVCTRPEPDTNPPDRLPAAGEEKL